MKAEGRNQKPETRNQKSEAIAATTAKPGTLLVSGFWFLVSACLLTSCHTVGISMTTGGYSEISAPIAAEMILDSQQIVVIDIRSSEVYRGPEGHIAGAINAPFDSIEMHLPELLPYQNQTVLVYGETSTDGAVAAQLLTVAGFHNVVHVNGGIKEWIERGYRTVHAQ
jgi:rhodanese-related sulfurtransferase